MKLFIDLSIMVLLVCGCSSSNKTCLVSRDYYDIVDDPHNDMSLWFQIKEDSVFLFYCNILNNGDYLNCPSDSTDYAGSFLLTETMDSSVQVAIKNYRYDDRYLVRLQFHPLSKKITWIIESGNVGYLPKNAEFISRQSN